MAFLRASLLLVFLTLLYWTTTSALSHDPTFNYTNSRPHTRVKRALPYFTQEKTREVLEGGKVALALVKDSFDMAQTTRTLAGITKKIAQGMSMLPSVLGLMFSFVNIILAFIPQESPTDQLQADLDEVNRKLDSLSMEISNLATDVEWHNYASVYSQDEVRILNAWKNFNEIFKSSMPAQSEEKKIRLAEMFTTFYENTATEGSVASLYHYLTVRGTSLSKNLLDILTRKSKCSITDIGMYSIYFNSLMYRGMFLNQVYWSLMGFDPSVKAAEYASMLKKIISAEKEAVNYCKSNYKKYVKMDVVEISKKYSYSNKEEIARQIKWALDKKYFWYSWVVVVYDTKQDYPDKTDGFTVIPMEKITVAVGETNIGSYGTNRDEVLKCIPKKTCDDRFAEIKGNGKICPVQHATSLTVGYSANRPLFRPIYFMSYVKLMHISYEKKSALFPPPNYQQDCSWYSSYTGSISLYYSGRTDLCSSDAQCMNGGTCQMQFESNQWVCECPDGYDGYTCKNQIPTFSQDIKKFVSEPLPAISTLKESLDKIYSLLQRNG
ncbi:SE-cephalotoxin-like [Myripristis murdjan]|uniref:SE-cephalotoxin-like n=1 Tax=Myripristis murdjan TaxID=586833 RepID=UPI001175F71F|nr:SE-cephalotoxin-like [Myripristis murdjan]